MELLKDIEDKAKELQQLIGEEGVVDMNKYPDAFISEIEENISEDLKN